MLDWVVANIQKGSIVLLFLVDREQRLKRGLTDDFFDSEVNESQLDDVADL